MTTLAPTYLDAALARIGTGVRVQSDGERYAITAPYEPQRGTGGEPIYARSESDARYIYLRVCECLLPCAPPTCEELLRSAHMWLPALPQHDDSAMTAEEIAAENWVNGRY